MTSKAIRDDIKTQWATKVPTLPLINEHNLDPKNTDAPLPDEWARIGYPFSNEERLSIGCEPSHWRETGQIIMRVYVKSGTGDTRALTLAEAVKSAWMYYTGLSGTLYFEAISPPLNLGDGESDGEWFALQVVVNYYRDTYK